jgi:hypothetical protein
LSCLIIYRRQTISSTTVLELDQVISYTHCGRAKLSLHSPEIIGYSLTLVGALKYQINDSAGNHIFYAGTSSATEQELFRIDGSGNCTALNNIIGVPRYGVRYKSSNQEIPSGGGLYLVGWANEVTGILGPANVLSNSTSGTLVVQFNYTIMWDPALGGGAVASFLRSGSSIRHSSNVQVFSSTFYATNEGSVIVTMEPGSTVDIVVQNNLGGPLSIKGSSGFGSPIVSRMSYYILN